MTSPGRPSLYRRDYCELASNYCLLGATNADLAAFFDVTTRTIDNWIANHPEFAAAVHEAKAMADARVARCLYQRAVGCEHTVERTVMHQGRVHTLTNKVHLPPDTRACIFWLRNRQPQSWGGRPTPPEDEDGIDDIARLEAAGEAARLAPTHRAPPLDALPRHLAHGEPARADEDQVDAEEDAERMSGRADDQGDTRHHGDDGGGLEAAEEAVGTDPESSDPLRPGLHEDERRRSSWIVPEFNHRPVSAGARRLKQPMSVSGLPKV